MQGITPQNRHIESLTQQFLNVHWDRKKPLLLGYSGGVDSKALLYALLDCGVIPHLAHADHGWREESGAEAAVLQEEAERLGCPFILSKLSLDEKTEEAARKERYSFFASLSSSYSALLLAHQADDLAETVLKRVFEGAHLCRLGGMEPAAFYYGMPVWRPFLFIRRGDLVEFLQQKGVAPFSDPSNSDPLYLRARLREEIFPFLNERFGKETVENLALLSERSVELKNYLDRRIEKTPIHKGPWGILVDLRELERIEQRHLLQKIGKDLSIFFSRDPLESLLNWVENREKSKYLIVKSKKIWVDNGRVWFFFQNATSLN